MSVFHYVADQLKEVALFDSETTDTIDTGAIFNDFDATPSDLLENDSSELFCFSQTTNVVNEEETSNSIIEAVDHAVMHEDFAVGVHANQLRWDTPLFDNESAVTDNTYLEKVYKLLTDKEHGLDDLTISKEAIKMFERRMRTNWEGTDSVYDAWLLRRGFQRTTFDYHEFDVLYPNWAEKIEKQNGKRKRNESSEEDDEEEESEQCIEEKDDKSRVKFVVMKPVKEVIVISSDEE